MCNYSVYLTRNLLNEHFYIGVHKENERDYYLGSEHALKKAIKKYGRENFERTILFECETAEKAFELEAALVTEKLVKNPYCYNQKKSGTGGFDHINNQKRLEGLRAYCKTRRLPVLQFRCQNCQREFGSTYKVAKFCGKSCAAFYNNAVRKGVR